MRSKEATNEYLEYIISSNSSDIDSLNLAKVSTWMIQDSQRKESPLNKLQMWEIDELRMILVGLIVDDYKGIPPVDSIFYNIPSSNSTRSLFSEITCNSKIKLTELQPYTFENTVFNGDVYIDIDSITRSAFYNAQFNKDVYVIEGCKQLEKWCFNSVFNGQIYLPKSITKIESMAFPDHMYTLDILHYAGTIDQFNELTKGADANVRYKKHKIVDVGVWPEIVHCSDGDWTSEYYVTHSK